MISRFINECSTVSEIAKAYNVEPVKLIEIIYRAFEPVNTACENINPSVYKRNLNPNEEKVYDKLLNELFKAGNMNVVSATANFHKFCEGINNICNL